MTEVVTHRRLRDPRAPPNQRSRPALSDPTELFLDVRNQLGLDRIGAEAAKLALFSSPQYDMLPITDRIPMSGRISEAHHSAAITRVLEIVPHAAAIREHVGEIVASPAFNGSRRSQEFLRHIIEKALNGQFEDLKERTLGIALFKRSPAYDTAEDAVVRVTACDVRKRLTHFYTESGCGSEVQIDLPPGSYIPEFRRSTAAISGVAAPFPIAPKVDERKSAWRPIPHRSLLAAATIATLLMLAVGGVVSLNRTAKPILPWSGIFERDKAVQVVLSDPDIASLQNMLEINLSLSDYANHRYLPDRTISPEFQHSIRGFRGANVALVDTMIALNISDLARTASQHMKIRTARSLQLPDLKVDDNFILLGSPRSNPWTKLFEDQLDFTFEFDQAANQEIIRNKRPNKNEPAAYIPSAKGWGTGNAYGIIGFVGNPGQAGDALLLAGSNAEATEAAGRLATNLTLLASTLKNCGVDPRGVKRHFEVLLKVATMAGSPNTFEVVACHSLPSQQK